MTTRYHLCSRCKDAEPVAGGYCRLCANAYMREARRKGKRHHNASEYHNVRVGEKTIREHRLVMNQFLERILSKDEWVHHKDEDPGNNAIENLQVVTPVEHYLLHHGQAGSAIVAEG
jgi:predicted amidophosphoribosyltransferase